MNNKSIFFMILSTVLWGSIFFVCPETEGETVCTQYMPPLEDMQLPPISATSSPELGVVGEPVIVHVNIMVDNRTSDIITLSSEFYNLPPMSTATLIPAIGYTPTFVPDVSGTYGVRIRVRDEIGRSAVAELNIVCQDKIPW